MIFEILPNLVISAYIIGYVYIIYYLFKHYYMPTRRGLKSKDCEKLFFKDLETQLKKGFVKNLKDLVRIQLAVADKMRFPPFASEDLAPLLRIYQREIPYFKQKNKNQNFKLLESLLKRLSKEKPFEALPERERELALSLQTNIKQENTGRALKQLDELTNSLGKEIKAAGGWSRKIILTTILGTIFGILGFLVIIFQLFLK